MLVSKKSRLLSLESGKEQLSNEVMLKVALVKLHTEKAQSKKIEKWKLAMKVQRSNLVFSKVCP